MSIELKTYGPVEGKSPAQFQQAEYVIRHSNERTTLEVDLSVQYTPWLGKEVAAELKFSPFECSTLDEAMDKFADWCERTAIALRNRVKEQDITTHWRMSNPVDKSEDKAGVPNENE